MSKLLDILPDKRMIHVAREIALDIHELEDILRNAAVSPEEFARWSHNEHFQSMLRDELAAWASATNTHERVKLKAAVVMENWLEQAHSILHDKTETLSGRAEIAKLLADMSGMRAKDMHVANAGDRLSITINLGDAKPLRVEKDMKVIEHTEDI